VVSGQQFLISRKPISDCDEDSNVEAAFDYEQFDHDDRKVKNVVGVYWLTHTRAKKVREE
jgi:hypothetical protein